MITRGLKGPSVRGALEERDKEKEVGYHMWEVPDKTSLINFLSTVILMCECAPILYIQLQFVHSHMSKNVRFTGTFDEVK